MTLNSNSDNDTKPLKASTTTKCYFTDIMVLIFILYCMT